MAARPSTAFFAPDVAGHDIALEDACGLAARRNECAGVLAFEREAEEASDVGDTETGIDAIGSIHGLLV
jgi:hypothetical protein